MVAESESGEVKWFGFGGIWVRGPSALVAAACGEICLRGVSSEVGVKYGCRLWLYRLCVLMNYNLV